MPDRSEADLIAAVLSGDTASFEPLIVRYQPKVFATARRYARREDEVEDIVQEVFLKAFQKLASYRAEAPFEHWLMRLAVRTCYDFLRAHQRNRETPISDFASEDADWVDRLAAGAEDDPSVESGSRELVQRLLEHLPPEARLVITLLELEDRSVKEIAALTGWSQPLVKVRAFRARRQMRRRLEQWIRERKV
jgi:RNA polymerase sigma-70 factor (ECF subfamily)